ncbi:MAG: sensor histidine kinase [Pseudomonadota bacterium]
MRLFVLILAPLIVVALIVGVWAYRDAEASAAERFDRSLLSTALAVSRDIAVTGGNALREDTRDLLRDTSGGAVFYHAYAPDGVFVTGYATPPLPPDAAAGDTAYTYFDAVYFGEPVRALRFAQQASIDGLSGLFTYTVWQATDVRDGFVETRTTPVFATIFSLIGALSLIVWFGVGRGLAPLVNLEEAIARRSIDDLSPIKRRIPQEVTGIVGRFNALLGELSASIRAKDAFISDAAHQLRNPIAGVIALAESVGNAGDHNAAAARAKDLREAAYDLGNLTNSLLTLERIKAGPVAMRTEDFDVVPILEALRQQTEKALQDRPVTLAFEPMDTPCHLYGDRVMFEQCIANVLHNAQVHSGPGLSKIMLSALSAKHDLTITVADDGKGIAPEDFERALDRFSQVGPSQGSGLGLPIAAAVVETFGGTISLSNEGETFAVTLTFPRPSQGENSGPS